MFVVEFGWRLDSVVTRLQRRLVLGDWRRLSCCRLIELLSGAVVDEVLGEVNDTHVGANGALVVMLFAQLLILI